MKKTTVKVYREGNFLAKTRSLLKKEARSFSQISNDSAIPYHWLCKFADGKIKDPSVNRVEWLHHYLTGKALKF